jgi:branched-chain amino acid transport system permease protein
MDAVRGLFTRQRSMLLVLAIFAVIAVFGGTVASPLLARIITVMFINLILVLGLQMFMGNSGYLSFAHVAFMGIGAYTSALLAMPVDIKASALPELYAPLAGIEWPFLPALLAAAAVAALVGGVVGFPLMRLSESAAAIASFALLVIVHVVLSQWSEVTNGPRTLFGVLRYTDLWTAAMWALATIVAAFLYKQSSLGLKLRASRDNLHAAASLGVNVVRVRFIAFVVSAFVCGVAGALWAHFITSFAPGAFYLSQTFVILTMLIVGGPRTVSGAALGVLLVTIVHEGLRHIENDFNVNATFPFQVVGMTEVLLAIALIAMLAFRPGGLIQRREIASRVVEAEPEPAAQPTQ